MRHGIFFDTYNPYRSLKDEWLKEAFYGTNNKKEYNNMFKHCVYPTCSIPAIKDVIFNDPATIVFWEDGTKTVVKVMDGDEFDPHTGLAQAIAKKAFGDGYKKEFKKWTKPYYKKKAELENMAEENANLLAKLATDIVDTIGKTKRMRGVID